VRERGAELREQQVSGHMPVGVVVGLESVEVEQHEGAAGFIVQRRREIELELAPVAQTGQGVRGGLDPARGEQRVVLAQRERHADEDDAQGGGGEARATALKCSGTPSARTPSASAPHPTGTNRPAPVVVRRAACAAGASVAARASPTMPVAASASAMAGGVVLPASRQARSGRSG
jgi:hypothetical protein